MKINWTVRIKNKLFWVTIIPMVLLLAQQVCALFGISFDISGLSESLVSIVGTVFGILAVVGIIIDPTTEGISDSARAMTYDEPNKDK